MKDLLGLAGLIVMVAGIALFSIPLALVAAGGIMLATAFVLAWVDATSKRGPDSEEP